MKKTVNVNIASCPFTLDEDAYEVLKSYLDDIASRLPATDCASMDNIEMRIARLLSSLLDSEQAIVSLPMISRIEDEIGCPGSFGRRADETLQRSAVERSLTAAAAEDADAETVVAEQVTLQTSAAHPFESPMREKPYEYPSHLYRSRDERIIAGVCGGLAKYVNWPVGRVRVVAAVLLLPAFLSLFLYSILWYLVPEEPLYDINGRMIDTDKK